MFDWHPTDLWLFPLGLAVSLVGTLVGVGGGFYIVPFLLLAWDPQHITPSVAAGTSLAIVLLKASSATVGNVRRQRIDYRVAVLFGLATIPGAILGPFLLPHIPRHTFQVSFAVLLLLTAAYLLLFSPREGAKPLLGGGAREIVESDGTKHGYEINFTAGILVSIVVGFVASLTGVGGGIIHMPLLVLFFAMPTRISSATSQLILVITAAVATVIYAWRGHVDLKLLFFLGLGGVAGAYLAVMIAGKVSPKMTKRFLAVVILVVASQLLAKALGFYK